MPELRQDILTERWVVIATERAKRPESFTMAKKEVVSPKSSCPFCEGHEKMTPPEVAALRPGSSAPNTPGWTVRVVPNKFPAFEGETGPLVRQGLHVERRAGGVHEVIVHSPDHNRDLGELPAEQVEQVLNAYVGRLDALRGHPHLEYALIILNHGKEAGASLEHPHSQLFGSPFVPPRIEEELSAFARHHDSRGECLLCEALAQEIAEGVRVVEESESYLCLAPYASRVPFELAIAPKAHAPDFLRAGDGHPRELAELLRSALVRLQRALADPPLNMLLHTRPPKDSSAPFHWHLEILPKLSIAAGFELGADTYINVVRPEECAAFLRDISL